MKRDGLKDRLLTKYGTISGAAKALGWDRKKVYRIVEGQNMKYSDVETLAEALGLYDSEDIVRTFFPELASKLIVRPVPDTISGPETAKKLRESYIKGFFGRLFHKG